MKKLKIATIVGTRPEIIRLSSLIKELEIHSKHTLIHTGQNYDYELSDIFFDDLGLKSPDFYLNALQKSAVETTGEIIKLSYKILKKIKPDAVVVLGDTNSCLSLYSAKRLKIPTFHLEAGNRCFDQRVPEEINRKIVDHIADVNLTYSQISREYLLKENFNPFSVIKVGSPMFEVLDDNIEKIQNSKILEKLNLKERKFFLVSCHREENIDSENFFKFISVLNDVATKYKLPVIVSTHPRTLKRIKKEKIKHSKNIILHKPFSFSDYNKLQLSSLCVLSDSGTITEESSILKFNAINIREAHERPEGMEEGTVIFTGMNNERVIQSLDVLLKQSKYGFKPKMVSDYKAPKVSSKVTRIILSYIDYVNNQIWKKT